MYFSDMANDVRPPELERPVLPQPLVMYKRNPFENDFGEWHQVWCTATPDGEFALCATHGWWDEEQKHGAVTARYWMRFTIQWKVSLPLFTNGLIT
jgi:hypothetical protein